METDILLAAYQERRLVEQQIATAVATLLLRSEDEGLQWHGPKTDLMEALHTAHATGLLLDEACRPMTFNSVVARACRILHTARPHNPYARAARGRSRKGQQAVSFAERCRLLLRRQPAANLLEELLHATI